MSAPTKGSGTTWVGRAIRRLEDPALVTGQGRFTADLPAAHWVRFVRSSVAVGKITNIAAPEGAHVITAADLTSVKKITPMPATLSTVPARVTSWPSRLSQEPAAAASPDRLKTAASAARETDKPLNIVLCPHRDYR